MAQSSTAGGVSRFGSTQRQDAWWVEILPVIVVLGAFGVYATLRAFEGKFYEWGPYLSPFYSPLIDPHHHWWPFSPAILILGGPTRISRYLLLLPQSVLPRIFPRSAGLCGERTKRAPIPRRNRVSIHSSKPPSLLFLPRDPVSLFPLVRRHSRLLFPGGIWNRRRLARDAG